MTCLDDMMNWTSIFLSLRCSFKKYNNNAPVGQPGAGTWNVDSSEPSAVRAVLNGARQQQPTQSTWFIFLLVV